MRTLWLFRHLATLGDRRDVPAALHRRGFGCDPNRLS
jgi:hypothetical protein